MRGISARKAKTAWEPEGEETLAGAAATSTPFAHDDAGEKTATKVLTGSVSQASGTSRLLAMSLKEMEQEKRRVKKMLRAFDVSFEKRFGHKVGGVCLKTPS